MENNIEVSIVVLTKNAEANIHYTLSMVLGQQIIKNLEVIAIDSGSTDRTVEIIRSFPSVRLIQKKPEEFQHGRTRNLGGKMAKGRYLVFLNGDAIPKDKYWLSKLLDYFEKDEKVVGVYSRHIPKENCHIYMAVELLGGMRPIKEVKNFFNLSGYDLQKHMLGLIRFSTVSCAIKKEVWDKMPFAENLPLAEDQEWSKRVLEAGYSIVYEPSSIVFHSHNRGLKQTFRYHYDCSMAFNSILKTKKSMKYFLRRMLIFPFLTFRELVALIRYAQRKKYGWRRILKEAIVSILSHISALLGEFCGNK